MRLKKGIILDFKDDFESYTKTIILKLEYLFRNGGFHTSRNNNRFEFKRIYKSTLYWRDNVLLYGSRILREGEINIERMTEKEIKISYYVKLDYILFMSLIVAILAGITDWIIDNDILYSILISFLTFIGLFFIGFLIIRFRMKNIIGQCI